jgi:hypothetical protein
MDVRAAEKKVREAEFFLERLREFEKRTFLVGEQFEFYLSALLHAGRAVDPLLRREHESLYVPWRVRWNAANGPADELIRFFEDDRNVEVREGGPKDEEPPATELPAAVTKTVTGPPGVFPLAAATKRPYVFEIDGADHKVTEVCAEYVKALKKIVDRFKADSG